MTCLNSYTIRMKTGFTNQTNEDVFSIQERRNGKYKFVTMEYVEGLKKRGTSIWISLQKLKI